VNNTTSRRAAVSSVAEYAIVTASCFKATGRRATVAWQVVAIVALLAGFDNTVTTDRTATTNNSVVCRTRDTVATTHHLGERLA
jgi:hypothetical protein